MGIRIVKAETEHLRPLALCLREADRREIKYQGGYSPIRALRHSLEASIEAWTAVDDEGPVAMFGYGDYSPLSYHGVFWMLGAERVRLYPRAFVKFGPVFIDEMLRHIESAENFIMDYNVLALRFARYLVKINPKRFSVEPHRGNMYRFCARR